MKKPVVGGLVSTLVFAVGCNNSAGPVDESTNNGTEHSKGTCEHAPQVLFDPDTGRMTIVSEELSEAIRTKLGIADHEASEREATIVFRSKIRKAGEDVAALSADDEDDIVNIGC